MRINLFLLLVTVLQFPCHSSNPVEKASKLSGENRPELEKALILAGENRPELEKVLEHYKNDPLKLKAAQFLIANMDVHYSYTSEKLDEYYEKLHGIFSMNGRSEWMTPKQDSLLKELRHPNPYQFKMVPDLQVMTAGLLSTISTGPLKHGNPRMQKDWVLKISANIYSHINRAMKRRLIGVLFIATVFRRL